MPRIVFPVLMSLALGLTTAPAATAFARAGSDDAELTRLAKEHYKTGLDAYQAGNYGVAIKELKKAYQLKHLPPLLLNLGATYRKMGENENAIAYYKKYLAEAPGAKDRGEVEGILAELQGGGAKEPAPPAAEPETRALAGWSHTPVDAAPPDMPVDVRVTTPVNKGVKVYLYYRDAGSADFTQVVMKRKGAEKIGRIPAAAMGGKSIQYYLEAKDDKGHVINKSGTPSDPNIVMIDPNAKPVMIAGEGNAEPAPTATGKTARSDLDDEAAPIMGTVASKGEGARHGAAPAGGKRFGGAFYTGIVFAVAGVALLGTGAWALGQAASYANALSSDSNGGTNGQPYKFNDPNATPYDDRTVEQRGRSYNTMGIGLVAAGSVAAVAGVVMIAVDQTVLARRRALEKQPRRTAWTLSPAVGKGYAGLGGALTF